MADSCWLLKLRKVQWGTGTRQCNVDCQPKADLYTLKSFGAFELEYLNGHC